VWWYRCPPCQVKGFASGWDMAMAINAAWCHLLEEDHEIHVRIHRNLFGAP
jgi:hypothetical protein